MAIDPSIPLSVRPPQLENPFDLFLKAQQAHALNDQRQAMAAERDAQAEAARQAAALRAQQAADRQATGEAIRQGGGVRDQTLAWARQNAPNAVPSLTKFFDESDESALKLRKARADLQSAQLDHLGHMADGILQHAKSPQELQAALATGLQLYGEQFPDEKDAIAQIGGKLQSMSPDQQMAFLQTQREAAPFYQAQQAKVAERAPVKVAAGETVLGPDNKPVFTAGPAPITPYQQAQLKLDQAKAAEAARHNRVSEQQANPLQSVGGGAAAPAVAPGTVDAAKNDAALAKLPPPVASQVKALSEGRMAFPTGFAISKPYWQNMLQLVGQYDPSFDAVNYNARAKTRSDFTSGKAAQQVNAIQTVIGHLADLSDKADALHNGNVQALNSVKNWIKSAGGDASVPSFETVKKGVTDELTRVWRQAGGAEADIKAWAQTLNSSQSPAQFRGVLSTVSDMLQSKLDALDTQYQQGMGTSKVSTITPQTKAVLQKLKGDSTAPASQPRAAGAAVAANGPKPGERRTINGQLAEWDGRGWKAVQ